MPLGAKGHIGLAKETTFGTPVAATAYVPFVSESIKEEIELVQDPSIRTYLDESEPYLGLKKYSGDLTVEAYPDVIGHILRSAMGAPTTTVKTTDQSYQHVFKPVDADFAALCAVPPLTLEVNRDLAQAVQYAGCVVDGFSFKCGSGQKIAQFVFNIIAAKRASIAKTTPTFGTVDPLLFNQLTFSIGGSANPDVEDVGVNFKNNLAGKATLAGGTEINRIVRDALRTADLDVTFDLTSETEYNKFLAGTVGAWQIKLEGAVIGTSTDKFTVQFDFPRVKYSAFPINVGGPKRLTVGAKAKVCHDKTAGYAMQVTLINGTATY